MFILYSYTDFQIDKNNIIVHILIILIMYYIIYVLQEVF